jgi:WD40 repeat protein
MFEQLVVVGPEGEPTRRRALASEVEAVLPDGDDEAGGGEGAVELWAQARLLTLDRHPESRAPTVEVAHEALLREWPRLHDWLEEDREDIVALAHLREAAAGWEALDRDPGGLYRGVRLEAALGVAKGRGRNLPPAETAFLDASRAERDAERRREVGRVRRLRAQLVAVAAALVVSLVVGAIAVGQRDRASDQSRLAESRELAAAANANLDVDPERSVLLALEAVERSRTGDDAPGGGALPEAVEALHTAVTTSRLELRVPGIGGAVAWSPAGDTFVTEGPEGSGDVDIRDVGTGESVRRWPGHDPDVNSVAYGPEGTTLLTTGDDGAARLWDPSTGEQLHVVAGEPGDDVWGPSVSPDGLLFAATWPTEGVTRVAEVATGRVVREVTSVPMPWQTAFSPDGSQLVVSSSDSAFARVVVIDVASGDTVHELANRGGVLPVAWSPDGSTIAVGSAGGVQLWDAASGQRRFALLGHEADVNDVDWSPDSAALASSGADGEVKVWVLLEGGGRELFALSSQEMRDGVLGVAFSPDGSRLVTGNRRVSATRVWNVGVGGDAEVANVPGLALRPTSAAFLGQGRQAVASGPGRTLTVWDVADARAGRTMGGAGPAAANPLVVRASPKQEVETIAVDREGTVVAMRVPVVGSLAWDVSAWDPRTGRELFAVRVDDEITNMRWSRDGRYLALSHSPLSYTRSGPRHVSVRDRAGREVADLAAPEGFFVSDAAFTADGRRLATAHVSLTGEGTSVVATWDWRAGREVGSVDTPDVEWTILGVDATRAVSLRRDGRVAVWDVTGRGEPVVLDGRTVGIEVLALSTDGRLVAGGGGDGTVRLWDARDGTELVTLRGHIGAVTDLSFRRDDRQLASSSVDGRTRIWALHLDDLEEIARRELTRGFTTDECRRYLHVDACADA